MIIDISVFQIVCNMVTGYIKHDISMSISSTWILKYGIVKHKFLTTCIRKTKLIYNYWSLHTIQHHKCPSKHMHIKMLDNRLRYQPVVVDCVRILKEWLSLPLIYQRIWHDIPNIQVTFNRLQKLDNSCSFHTKTSWSDPNIANISLMSHTYIVNTYCEYMQSTCGYKSWSA